MRWFRYLLCFLAGAALIHVLPHLLNVLTPRNLLGVAVSLLVGTALLWLARFNWRDPIAVALVLLGMAAILLYGHLASRNEATSVRATAASCEPPTDPARPPPATSA